MKDLHPGAVVRLKSGGPFMTVRCIIEYTAALATGCEQGVVCDWIDHSGNPHQVTFLAEQFHEEVR